MSQVTQANADGIVFTDSNGDVMMSYGDGVPPDGRKGYGKGSWFIRRDATGAIADNTWYINTGTNQSTTWVAIELP